MSGMNRQFGFDDFDMAQTEAMEIRRGDIDGRSIACWSASVRGTGGDRSGRQCRCTVLAQASQMATDAQMNGELTLASLRDAAARAGDASMPRRRVIFVSEGFLDRGDARLGARAGTLAGLARTSLYALRLDNRMFDIADPRLAVAPAFDRQTLIEGLDTLAAAARGAMFNITGSGARRLRADRIRAVGLLHARSSKSGPADKNGSAHPIRVEVVRRGAVVRSRRILKGDSAGPDVPIPAAGGGVGAGHAAAALGAPAEGGRLLAARTGERQGSSSCIHADIGAGYTAAQQVALAYYITDAGGRLVETQTVDARLPPVMRGVPSPLQYVAGASLPPGDYVFKLAVVDGDRIGIDRAPVPRRDRPMPATSRSAI